MREAPQPALNGAYYGPSIPPPAPKAYYRPRRGTDCCCCGCFGCCASCILSLLFKLIFTALIVIAAAALVLWFIFRPNKIKFHVTDASLTQFNLTTPSNLHYNLSLNLTIRNPNKRLGVYYDRVEARPYFHDLGLDPVQLESFYQGKKNTTEIHVGFNGQSELRVGSAERSDYESGKKTGVVEINLKLYLRGRFKFWWFKSPHVKPEIGCDLKVPISDRGSASQSFERTECHFDF